LIGPTMRREKEWAQERIAAVRLSVQVANCGSTQKAELPIGQVRPGYRKKRI